HIRNVRVAWRRGRAAARKARYREIEAAPEKMYRADLPDKAPAEGREHLIDLREGAPEAVDLHGIVGGVNVVLIKADRIGHLDRHRPDPQVNPERAQSPHDL